MGKTSNRRRQQHRRAQRSRERRKAAEVWRWWQDPDERRAQAASRLRAGLPPLAETSMAMAKRWRGVLDGLS